MEETQRRLCTKPHTTTAELCQPGEAPTVPVVLMGVDVFHHTRAPIRKRVRTETMHRFGTPTCLTLLTVDPGWMWIIRTRTEKDGSGPLSSLTPADWRIGIELEKYKKTPMCYPYRDPFSYLLIR